MDNNINEIIDADMYEVPKDISKTEAIIYDWVVEHFGESEAEDPSWNIHLLAQYIDEQSIGEYEQKNTVKYRL